MKIIHCLASAGLAFAVGQMAHAQSFTNGDFGAGSPSTPTGLVNGPVGTSGGLSGWGTFYGSGGNSGTVFLDQNLNYGLTPSPGNGSDYFLDLTGSTDGPQGMTSGTSTNYPEYGGIFQTLTGLTSGDTYKVSFALGNNNASGGPSNVGGQNNYDYNGNLPGVEVSGGGSAANFWASAGGDDLWDSDAYVFTASGTSATITFTGFAFAPGGGQPTSNIAYIGLDNVSLSNITRTGVPDSGSTVILLAVGLIFIALGRKVQGQAA
jgi:hypothetical protein